MSTTTDKEPDTRGIRTSGDIAPVTPCTTHVKFSAGTVKQSMTLAAAIYG